MIGALNSYALGTVALNAAVTLGVQTAPAWVQIKLAAPDRWTQRPKADWWGCIAVKDIWTLKG